MQDHAKKDIKLSCYQQSSKWDRGGTKLLPRGHQKFAGEHNDDVKMHGVLNPSRERLIYSLGDKCFKYLRYN